MFQFQNYPLNDLWAGRKYIVDMWAKPLGLAGGGSQPGAPREMEKEATTARGRDGETCLWCWRGEEKERRKRDAHGCRWETNDRRPTEDTSKLLHGVAVPPLFTCPLYVYSSWRPLESRANDLLAKYSGKRRRVPPASFSNEYFDTGDASDVSPSPVSLCLIYRTLAKRFLRRLSSASSCWELSL